MRVEVVRDGDLVVAEGRRDEADAERLACVAQARGRGERELWLGGGGGEGGRLGLKRGEEAMRDVAESNEQGEVARGLGGKRLW